MQQDKRIKIIEQYVKTMRWTPGDFYWKHAFQVRDLGMLLQGEVGGDREVVEISALLHDIGKAKLLGPGHEEISTGLAKKLLEKLAYSMKTVDQVLGCISYKRSAYIEEKTLRSADSMALILDKDGQKWYFENVLKNNNKRILLEVESSYSEIGFDFARKLVEKTYRKLRKHYA